MAEDVSIGVIDQGTTGTRFVIFDRSGRPSTKAFSKHSRLTDPPDRVEYDPLDIWASATDAIQRGLQRATVDADELTALGVTTQRQTTVVWERESGRPVANAISWQDRRTADRIDSLEAGTADAIRERTGLVPDTYFSAPKLEWLLDNAGDGDGELRRRAAAGDVLFGTVDAWLVYNLTGRHATDVTNAAQTLLYNVYEGNWDDETLETFDVPRTMLPEVRPSSDPDGYGTTDPDGILAAEIPVTGVLGDQQASLVGQAGFEEGDAKVTFGSGNFYLQNTGTKPVRTDGELLTTIWFQRAGEEPLYALEGPVFSTGTALEWLEQIGLLDDPGCVATMARSVGSSEGVFVVPAFSGLGAPDWDAAARGAILGLSPHTGVEHIVRATVESIAFGTRATVEAAEEATGVAHDRLYVDGRAVYDDEYAELQATLLGTPLVRSHVYQTTALGAAFTAGLAIGVWDSLEEVRERWTVDRTIVPESGGEAIDREYLAWRDVVDGVRSITGNRSRRS